MAQLARKVVDQNLSLREAAQSNKRPVFYKFNDVVSDEPLPALSHSSIWRWLGFCGAMTISLQVATDAFLQANPDSDLHRFQGHVDPRRARSPQRLEILRIARRLLHLQTRWDRCFLTTPFFARFATRCRPP